MKPAEEAMTELRQVGFSLAIAWRLWSNRVRLIAILQHWGAKS